MNIKFILYFGFLFITTSCSIFINKIDDDLLNKQSVTYKKDILSKTFCEKVHNFEFISEDKITQKYFTKFLNDISKTIKLTYADKVVLWSLTQMNVRPNHSSPTAKIQFFFKKNNRTYFYHIYSKQKDDVYPYLHGLELILEKFGTNHGLKKLARLFDENDKSQFFVSNYFASFLKVKQKELSSNKVLKRSYIRGDETLKKGERVNKQRIYPIVSRYIKTKSKSKYIVSNYLFEYKRNNNIVASCNYDLGLYSSSIYLIHDEIIKSNTFGFRDRENIFLADSTQEFDQMTPLHSTLFFKGSSNVRSPALCKFHKPLIKDWQMWLISTESRDPGQHLFHLVEYGLQDIENINQISKMLKFSRHLFLKKPIRLIFESQRSNSQQLDELLKLNIPIYNANKLARIWGSFNVKTKKQFFIDERMTGSLSCQ